MNGKRLIEKIRLRNILSFGDKGEEITLEPLNIIIGQNASGKSNLVDVIKLLGAFPENNGLASFISKSGGVSEWLWKGKKTFGDWIMQKRRHVSTAKYYKFFDKTQLGIFYFSQLSNLQ